ncbi:hypothetical protein [Methylococcus mesophilus]|uniref:hypothetical protein n=1 Tax=Methylococcus mesophilus TaxID=2993564 RepID=UPI00224B16B9|nr:hypothetical protein [Methylococcus mesophilus]UZR27661.1 hypothetical protein OOT43_13080 [Methylococcus mesophilus]
MKKTFSTYTVFAALLLAAPLAGAAEYPPDFEPSVIYQDPSLVGKAGAAPAAAAPAAKPQAAPAAPASKAPAAQPAVTAPAETAPSTAKPAAQDAGSDYYLFGGVVVALIGFVVWSSRRPAAARPAAAAAPAAAPAPAATGATGVAKYLQAQGLSAGDAGAETGVAKYLKALPEPVRGLKPVWPSTSRACRCPKWPPRSKPVSPSTSRTCPNPPSWQRAKLASPST